VDSDKARPGLEASVRAAEAAAVFKTKRRRVNMAGQVYRLWCGRVKRLALVSCGARLSSIQCGSGLGV